MSEIGGEFSQPTPDGFTPEQLAAAVEESKNWPKLGGVRKSAEQIAQEEKAFEDLQARGLRGRQDDDHTESGIPQTSSREIIGAPDEKAGLFDEDMLRALTEEVNERLGEPTISKEFADKLLQENGKPFDKQQLETVRAFLSNALDKKKKS